MEQVDLLLHFPHCQLGLPFSLVLFHLLASFKHFVAIVCLLCYSLSPLIYYFFSKSLCYQFSGTWGGNSTKCIYSICHIELEVWTDQRRRKYKIKQQFFAYLIGNMLDKSL